MIAITLNEPTVAIMVERTDLDRAWVYTTHIGQLYHAANPDARWFGPGHPNAPDGPPPVSGVHTSRFHLYLSPSGYARKEEFARKDDGSPIHIIELVDDVEHTWWYVSGLAPDDPTPRPIRNRYDRNDQGVQAFEEAFGKNYPNEALALLNPQLMMSDYVRVPGSERPTSHLGRATATHELRQHPDRPFYATDDAERLGSLHVEVAFTIDDPPMLLEWSALHDGEPFSTTRVAWLHQGVDLDPAIFTDPRIPAPPLPFD